MQCAAAHFGRVSVVMMARVNCSNEPGAELPLTCNVGIARRIRSVLIGRPITPVEQTRICSARQPIARAVAAAVRFDAARPASPVAQFAFPELTMTALIFDSERFR